MRQRNTDTGNSRAIPFTIRLLFAVRSLCLPLTRARSGVRVCACPCAPYSSFLRKSHAVFRKVELECSSRRGCCLVCPASSDGAAPLRFPSFSRKRVHLSPVCANYRCSAGSMKVLKSAGLDALCTGTDGACEDLECCISTGGERRISPNAFALMPLSYHLDSCQYMLGTAVVASTRSLLLCTENQAHRIGRTFDSHYNSASLYLVVGTGGWLFRSARAPCQPCSRCAQSGVSRRPGLRVVGVFPLVLRLPVSYVRK